MDGKYYVTYDITPHPDGLTKEQVPEGKGACDCIVLYSVIGVPGGGGGLSTVIATLNGKTGDKLTPEQEFQLWALWAHDLVNKLPEGGRRDLASLVHSAIRDVALQGRRMDIPEQIEAAAIKHGNGTVYSVPRPGRHNHVIAEMKRQGVKYTDPEYEAKHVQGFVTSLGRFVDRKEAKVIATKLGQLLERASGSEDLFSEDVW